MTFEDEKRSTETFKVSVLTQGNRVHGPNDSPVTRVSYPNETPILKGVIFSFYTHLLNLVSYRDFNSQFLVSGTEVRTHNPKLNRGVTNKGRIE